MSDYYEMRDAAARELERIANEAAALTSQAELLQYIRATLAGIDTVTADFHFRLRAIMTQCPHAQNDLQMVLGYWRDHIGPVWFKEEDDEFMALYSAETVEDGEFVCEACHVSEVPEDERERWVPLSWVYRCEGEHPDDLYIQVLKKS